MWDTRFSGWIPDFKLLVSSWILLENSNLKTWDVDQGLRACSYEPGTAGLARLTGLVFECRDPASHIVFILI
jgi:hypothetical protein